MRTRWRRSARAGGTRAGAWTTAAGASRCRWTSLGSAPWCESTHARGIEESIKVCPCYAWAARHGESLPVQGCKGSGAAGVSPKRASV